MLTRRIGLGFVGTIMLLSTVPCWAGSGEGLVSTDEDPPVAKVAQSVNTDPPLRPAQPAPPSQGTQKSQPSQQSATKPNKTPYSLHLSDLPKKTVGFLIGSVVGIPVCMVRNPVSEEKWSVDNWTGDNKDKPRVAVPAGIAFAPFAAVDGVLLSPFSSIKHSWQKFDDPFSKGQFSLGPLAPDKPFVPEPNSER